MSEGVAFGVGDARGSVVAAPVSDEGVAVGVRLNDATGIAWSAMASNTSTIIEAKSSLLKEKVAIVKFERFSLDIKLIDEQEIFAEIFISYLGLEEFEWRTVRRLGIYSSDIWVWCYPLPHDGLITQKFSCVVVSYNTPVPNS